MSLLVAQALAPLFLGIASGDQIANVFVNEPTQIAYVRQQQLDTSSKTRYRRRAYDQQYELPSGSGSKTTHRDYKETLREAQKLRIEEEIKRRAKIDVEDDSYIEYKEEFKAEQRKRMEDDIRRRGGTLRGEKLRADPLLREGRRGRRVREGIDDQKNVEEGVTTTNPKQPVDCSRVSPRRRPFCERVNGQIQGFGESK